MASDGRIFVTLVGVLKRDAQAQVHTTEADGRVSVGRVELAALAGFEGNVVAFGVGDLVLGTAQELDLVRLAAAEAVVVGSTGRHLPIGQADTAVVGRRRNQLGLSTAGIERLFECVIAGFVGRQAKHVAHLQVQLALVALVAVGAIGIARIGWRVALEPEKIYLPLSSLLFIRLNSWSSSEPVRRRWPCGQSL